MAASGLYLSVSVKMADLVQSDPATVIPARNGSLDNGHRLVLNSILTSYGSMTFLLFRWVWLNLHSLPQRQYQYACKGHEEWGGG